MNDVQEQKETTMWTYIKRSILLGIFIGGAFSFAFDLTAGINPFSESLIVYIINATIIFLVISFILAFMNKINILKGEGKRFFKKKRRMV